MEVIALVLLLLAIVLLQGWLFNSFSAHRLDYRCEFSVKEACEGDEIFLVETVYNKKLLPIPWLKVDIHSSRWLDFAESHSLVAQEDRRVTSSFLLRGYQRTTRRWRLKCLKRGVFVTENVTLIWGDLLGMHTNSKPVRVNASLKVYPGRIGFNGLFMPLNWLQGDILVNRWIIDDPFIVSGAREYTPGDPMNRIHWSATAKEGRLMVRKNDFTSQYGFTIVLNIQSIEYEPKDVVYRERVELGIKAAATLLDNSLRAGTPVRLATNGITKDGGRQAIFTDKASGREHVRSLMDILAGLLPVNVRDIEDFLEEVRQKVQNEEIILITCYLGKGLCRQITNLKAGGNTVRAILLDSYINTEELPADTGVYMIGEQLPDAGICIPAEGG